MEKRYKLKVLEMNQKTPEQLEKERELNNRNNYNNFSNEIRPMEQQYNYLGVIEVELTQEEYDIVRHAVINK